MSILTRVTKDGVQTVHEVINPSISSDGRYILASSSFGFDSTDLTFRYDNQTGGLIDGFATDRRFEGYDLSGDGRYWVFVDTIGIAAVAFPRGIADFSSQSVAVTYSVGPRGAGNNLAAISQDGTAVSIRFTEQAPFPTSGPSEVRISYWQGGGELRVPGSSSTTTSLTDDSISGAGERVVFSLGGSVYYADATGGAPGFTQAPVLIAQGANAAISANGRFVVFETSAALLGSDTNPGQDIYLKDLQTNTLTLVSTATGGTVSDGFSADASLSDDGRYVVFESDATNLVAGDTNAARDIFLKDLVSGVTTRVSVSNGGAQANGRSSVAEISADGSTVTFMSLASNLLSDDTNGLFDVFRVALGAVRTVNGDEITATDSYQLQAGERVLHLSGTSGSFGFGNELDNSLFGDAAANVLRGLGGADSLVGSLGADRFAFTAAAVQDGESGIFDTLADYSFSEGDQLDVAEIVSAALDAGQPVFSLVRVVNDLNATFSRLEVDADGAANGVNFVTIAHLQGVQRGATVNVILDTGQPSGSNITVRPAASPPNDVNADGTSDVLLRHANGFVAEWQMSAGQIVDSLGIAMPSTAYKFQDTGDFNGDGRSDILWRHDNGQVVMWELDGNQIILNQEVTTLSNSWHNEGAGDFNGDGASDILWRHDSGQVVLWQMDGPNIVSNQSIATPGNDWHVQGLVDTDGDGKTDVLLRHNSGQVVLWKMDGAKIASNQAIATPGLDWNVAGTGDFNGDGRGDILWRNDSGQVVLWEMDGANIVSNQSIATPSNAWRIQDVGDYSSDGNSDVLWRHDGGQVVLWEMNGAQIALNHEVVPQLGSEWSILNHQYDLL